VQGKEVAGDRAQDEGFQAREVEEPVMQGFAEGGEEGLGRIGALQLEQPAQRPLAAPGDVALEGGEVAVEGLVLAAELGFRGRGPRRSAWRPGRV